MKKISPLSVLLLTAFTIGAQTVLAQSKKKRVPAKPAVTVISRAETVPSKTEEAETFAELSKIDAERICALCISKSYDKVTDRVSLLGRRITVTSDKKTGFLINTYRFSDDSIVLSFKVVGGGPCMAEDAGIWFLFRDGTRTSAASGSSFNCDGKAVIYFKDIFGNADLLAKLKTKPIETLRVETYKSSVTEDFSRAQSIELMNQMNCLDR